MADVPEIEEARDLIAGIVHDVDPQVHIHVDDYRWHGERVLDVRLSKGNRTSRLEVTEDRLRAAREAGEPLRLDLEKAVMDLGDEDIGVY